MKRNKLISALSLIVSLSACDAPVEAPAVADADTAPPAEVTGAALDVERATRMVDRGQDLTEARGLLEAALQSQELTVDERGLAIVALSRVAEAEGDRERAITLVEDELSRPRENANRTSRRQALRGRLRELLNGSAEQPPALVPDVEAAPFAEYLSRYFPAAPSGEVAVKTVLFGGSREVTEAAGTFDIAAGYRAAREKACPLCKLQIDMRSSTSRSGDWTAIPDSAEQMKDAVVVFYFDLERNRIPTRYEDLLPMPVAEVEAKVKAGDGFAIAEERDDAPPVILIAAPRTVMLEDVEKALAEAGELPTEPLDVTLERKLYPQEIQTVIRNDYFGQARSCYDALLKSSPAAAGKVVLALEVDAAGAVAELALESEGLQDETFLACMKRPAQDLSFPASGAAMTIRYPVVFSPQ